MSVDKQIGMNPDAVESHLGSLSMNIAALSNIETQLSTARAASLDPLSYGITPGAWIIAPWAIAGTTLAQHQLTQAQNNAAALIEVLHNEIAEQRLASAEETMFISDVDARKAMKPKKDDNESEPWWEKVKKYFENFELVHGGVELAATAAGAAVKAWWLVNNVTGIRTLGALKGAWDWAATAVDAPKLTEFMESPALKAIGKPLAVVGAVLSTATAVTTWMDPKSTAWDKTRDTVSAGLAVTGTVLLFTPAAPVGVAILAVGAVWAIGTTIYDNRKAIGKWMGEAGKNVANFTKDVATGYVNTVKDVVHTTEKAVDKTIDDGKKFVSGISHSLGFGWP